ncbi:hypothetical protein [Streptomyces sp. NPDC002889]|uniref:TRAFAC clade GTPase domain-containing protein n=1 Tax=Streptomyces sp. NPDC002889 TaxID=3364669 RepID=UPI0036781660
MDIVMLGHSAAGKTTYVSLMYAAMHGGIEGFGLRAENVSDHRVLSAAAEAVLRGRYPNVSNQRSVFEFVLQYEGQDVFPFRWRDYRGGALRERKGNSEQAQQLHEDLMAAQAVVLFADAHRLVTVPGSARELRRMIMLVRSAMAERTTELTPVVLTFTKCDLIDMNQDGNLDRVVGPFQELIDAVAATQHLRGAFVPVACGPEPVNVVFPALWSLFYGIAGRALALEASLEQSLESARNAAARDTWWDRLASPLIGEDTWAEISARHQRTAEAEYERLEPLLAPAQRLEQLLEDVPSF